MARFGVAEAWSVVHAQWSQAADWSASPIPGLSGVGTSSSVAATRDSAGRVHVLVQTLDRRGTQHARLQDNGKWVTGAGPQLRPPIGPPTPAEPPRDFWCTLHLAALHDAVLLVGITRLGEFGWSSWTDSWSDVELLPPVEDHNHFPLAAFSTASRLLLAPRGQSDLDVFGIAENGLIAARTLHVDAQGAAHLAQP